MCGTGWKYRPMPLSFLPIFFSIEEMKTSLPLPSSVTPKILSTKQTLSEQHISGNSQQNKKFFFSPFL